MLDPAIEPLLPLSAFLLGIGGSLHCVGMCGGLVMASTESRKGVVLYQFGRLFGYLVLATIASFIGVKLNEYSSIFGVIGTLALGGFFVLWGIQTWRQRPIEFKLPGFFSRFVQSLWRWNLRLPKTSSFKSFFTGSLSLFLPCGLLYGVLFGLVVLNRPENLIFGIIAFWLGTLPAMLFAPELMQKILRPLSFSSPRLLSLFFISLGLFTVTWRFRQVIAPELFGADLGGETCH